MSRISLRHAPMLFCCLVCTGLFLGCNLRISPPIYFEIPMNYTGPFALILDPINGNPTVLQNGRFIYIIPTNGFLILKTFSPFEHPHKEFALYSNEAQLQMEDPDPTQTPADAIVCRDTGMHEDPGSHSDTIRSIVYVIGTEKQKDQVIATRQWRLLSPEYKKTP